jgi:hypothetical protein
MSSFGLNLGLQDRQFDLVWSLFFTIGFLIPGESEASQSFLPQ